MARGVMGGRRSVTALRWMLAIILGAVWLLAMAHFGVPALALGLVLLAARRLPGSRAVSWSVTAGVAAFVGIAAMVAPWSCTAIVALTGYQHTECSNPIGIRYTGGGGYDAPLWPALVAGLSAGLAAALVTWLALRRRPSGPIE